jgi:hypothetical protein
MEGQDTDHQTWSAVGTTTYRSMKSFGYASIRAESGTLHISPRDARWLATGVDIDVLPLGFVCSIMSKQRADVDFGVIDGK